MSIDNNIIDLALEIDQEIKNWRKLNPENTSQTECEKHVMYKIMKKGGGHLNPKFIDWVIHFHREGFSKQGFIVQC